MLFFFFFFFNGGSIWTVTSWQYPSTLLNALVTTLLRLAIWDLEITHESFDRRVELPVYFKSAPGWEISETPIFWHYDFLIIVCGALDTAAAVLRAQVFLYDHCCGSLDEMEAAVYCPSCYTWKHMKCIGLGCTPPARRYTRPDCHENKGCSSLVLHDIRQTSGRQGEAQGVFLESQAISEPFKCVLHLLHIFDQNVGF